MFMRFPPNRHVTQIQFTYVDTQDNIKGLNIRSFSN